MFQARKEFMQIFRMLNSACLIKLFTQEATGFCLTVTFLHGLLLLYCKFC